MIRSATRDSIERLSLAAEFFLRDAQGRTQRIGGERIVVVGVGDVPIPPGADQTVRLRADGGVAGYSPREATRVDLYYRTDGDWVRFGSFDVDPVLR